MNVCSRSQVEKVGEGNGGESGEGMEEVRGERMKVRVVRDGGEW